MELQQIVGWEWVIFKVSIYLEHMFLASIKHRFWQDISYTCKAVTHTILLYFNDMRSFIH
jgi:hypothetical protein